MKLEIPDFVGLQYNGYSNNNMWYGPLSEDLEDGHRDDTGGHEGLVHIQPRQVQQVCN